MPKDFLFPSVAGVSRVVTLTSNRAFGPDLLGVMVNLAGHSIELVTPTGEGYFVVCGPGTLVSEPNVVLASDEAATIAVSGGLYKFVDGGAAMSAALSAHMGNTSNPHSVTKGQLGLGNVNNTADSEKPVSTAQAKAIADASLPRAIAITGALWTSYENPFVFPVLLRDEDYEGFPQYTLDGKGDDSICAYAYNGVLYVESNVGHGGTWTSTAPVSDFTLVSKLYPGAWNEISNPHAWKPSSFSFGVPVVSSADIVTRDTAKAAGAALRPEFKSANFTAVSGCEYLVASAGTVTMAVPAGGKPGDMIVAHVAAGSLSVSPGGLVVQAGKTLRCVWSYNGSWVTMTTATGEHASTHGVGGSDPVTPAMIGAASTQDLLGFQAAVLTRTTAQGAPVSPAPTVDLIVSGAVSPGVNGLMPRLDPYSEGLPQSGKYAYGDLLVGRPSITSPSDGGIYWRISLTGSEGTGWVSSQNVATPDLVTVWTPVGGATGSISVVPAMSAPVPAPTRIGQLCRVGDQPGPYSWYRWDGSVWTLLPSMADIPVVEDPVVSVPAPVIRTVAEGVPAAPSTIMRVSGAGYSAVNGDYVASGESLGVTAWLLPGTGAEIKRQWEVGGGAQRWVIEHAGPYRYQSSEDPITPDMVEEWSVASGTLPAPTVEKVVLNPAEVGQLCRVGDGSGPFVWYRFDGYAWVNITVTLGSILSLLGVATYANESAALLSLTQGSVYFDTSLGRLHSTSSGAF